MTRILIQLPFRYIKGAQEFTITSEQNCTWVEDPSVQLGDFTDIVQVDLIPGQRINVVKYSFLYYTRATYADPWKLTPEVSTRLPASLEIINKVGILDSKYKRDRGRADLNFMWMHATNMYHLVDPSATNINDAFVIQKGYYNDMLSWLNGIGPEPILPTPIQLRNDYKDLLTNAMISDTVIFHPGKIKLIFGSKSIPQLQAKLVVVKNTRSVLTDSQIKVKVKEATRQFFDIMSWEFGETFYFTELAASIHSSMAADINSVVLVPVYPDHFFGDMFQVNMAEDEIIQADIDVEDIMLVSNLNPTSIYQYR
jgi:hypothetical protein